MKRLRENFKNADFGSKNRTFTSFWAKQENIKKDQKRHYLHKNPKNPGMMPGKSLNLQE